MGKRKRSAQSGLQGHELTHEEIWDDSALIDSWNDALEEYKLYHSIHARGENVEEVIKQAELKENMEADGHVDQVGQTTGAEKETREEEEEGEIEDDQAAPEVTGAPVAISSTVSDLSGKPTMAQPAPNGIAPASGVPAVPQHLLGGVQDEALKNLMMSWYYAGYYTGLYEGQQRAQQASSEQLRKGGSAG